MLAHHLSPSTTVCYTREILWDFVASIHNPLIDADLNFLNPFVLRSSKLPPLLVDYIVFGPIRKITSPQMIFFNMRTRESHLVGLNLSESPAKAMGGLPRKFLHDGFLHDGLSQQNKLRYYSFNFPTV